LVNRERLLAEFLRLVQIDSPSYQERELADRIRNLLAEIGLTVFEDQTASKINGQAGNLYARWPGTVAGPAILFCVHLDTVEPGRRIEPVIRGGAVYSDGRTILGADDKAGIAAVIEALRVVRERNLATPPVELIFTVAEEQGLVGAKHLDPELINASCGFVLDSDGPPGKIIVRAPSQDRIVVTVRGRAAHAGINPEEGINAIQAAARGIARLRLGRIDEETTANIGVIQGGLATNIVPEKVIVYGETRSLDDRKRAAVTQEIIRLFNEEVENAGGQVECEVEDLYPSFRLEPDHRVVQMAMRAAFRVGLAPRLAHSGGGSDANILNALGVPTANLSCGMQKVHSTGEFILIEDLVKSTELVLEIMKA
jgi:tripeptide aminopeptidase